jgi:hypothetical protein
MPNDLCLGVICYMAGFLFPILVYFGRVWWKSR